MSQRPKRPLIRSASSSPVAPDRVWKRQCSARRSPSKAPRWVWVLPTSTARSTAAIMMPRVEARLYAIPASHPSLAIALMLERKGIAYKRTDLFPAISRGIVRALGFPGKTVPALKIEGRKLVGSREISRVLDEIRPDPPLFPSDPEKRAAVEEAERFGDEELQHPIRQISWWAIKRDGSSLRSYSEGAKLGIPIGLAVRTAAPIIALEVRINDADEENVRR